MKKAISIKIDERLWVFIKDKPNKSQFIEELITEYIQAKNTKPIVMAVTTELLSSEAFFNEIRNRLQLPVTKNSITNGITVGVNSEIPRSNEFEPVKVGFPCCQETKRCKHWQFNELGDGWVNSLTGQIRETL